MWNGEESLVLFYVSLFFWLKSFCSFLLGEKNKRISIKQTKKGYCFLCEKYKDWSLNSWCLLDELDVDFLLVLDGFGFSENGSTIWEREPIFGTKEQGCRRSIHSIQRIINGQERGEACGASARPLFDPAVHQEFPAGCSISGGSSLCSLIRFQECSCRESSYVSSNQC